MGWSYDLQIFKPTNEQSYTVINIWHTPECEHLMVYIHDLNDSAEQIHAV
jgi:hypothetical protein